MVAVRRDMGRRGGALKIRSVKNKYMYTRVIKRVVVLFSSLLLITVCQAAQIRIASLNPIMSDLARSIGGEHVEVLDLMPLDADPHAFYPSPSDLKTASAADLILASGKGLETYLDECVQSLGGHIPVYEAGRLVPSLRVEVSDVFICCPTHSHGALDPHWWHSVRNMQRAARLLKAELVNIDAEHAEDYRRQHEKYDTRLDELHEWIQDRISEVPRADRELTTAHAAFGYYCREFGLRAISIQGLTTEQNPDPGYLKEVIQTLRDHHVRAVFPEKNANPELLQSMAQEAGVVIGGHLYSGSLPPESPTYESMMRKNTGTIVTALTDGTPAD